MYFVFIFVVFLVPAGWGPRSSSQVCVCGSGPSHNDGYIPRLQVCLWEQGQWILSNTLRPRQNGPCLADDHLKCIFFNENVWIPIKISLKFVGKNQVNNIPAVVQIMAWRQPGDKPLSEPMMASLPTYMYMHHSAHWPLGDLNTISDTQFSS